MIKNFDLPTFLHRFFELTGFERERFIGKTRVEISGEKSNDRDWQSHLAGPKRAPAI